MAAMGAPTGYLAVNAGALALSTAWALFGQAPRGEKPRRILMLVLLALLFVPLLTGPDLNGIARWLPFGPFMLAGAWIGILFGEILADWYLGLFAIA